MPFFIKEKINSVLYHKGFQKYAFNAGWLFFEKLLRIVAMLSVGIYVARYLGPEKFGIFSYALAFVALFGAIARLGLDGIMVRELVNFTDKRDVYMGTAFWLKAGGALLTLAFIAFAVQFTDNDAVTRLYILIIAAGLIFQSFDVIDFYFQSKVLNKYVSYCKITQLVTYSGLNLYFIFIKADLFWFVLVSLIDYIVLGVALAFAYMKQNNGYFYTIFDAAVAKALLKDSWPLILSGISVMLYMRIDQVMIKAKLGDYEVGLYSAAVRLSEAWYFVPVIIKNSLFPAIINAKKANIQLYYNRLQKLFTLMVWLAIAIALPMTFLSQWLVQMLYGSVYLGAGKVLMIHIWAGVFVFLGTASGSWYINENLQKLAFYRTFLGAVVNIILNLFLIKYLGISGAAVSTVMSFMAAGLFFDFFNIKTRNIFYIKIKAFLLEF